MKLLDRLVFWSFLKAWLICFVSLASLYIVLDAFQKLEDFQTAAEASKSQSFLQILGTYYSVKLSVIFDIFNGMMTLLASLFTLAWMQKTNEIVPLLASGTPLRRLLQPLLIAALLVIGLAIANRELLLPEAMAALQEPGRDARSGKIKGIGGLYDAADIHVECESASAKEKVVYRFACTLPVRRPGALLHVRAAEAYWIPPAGKPHTGGWLLVDTTPAELPPGHDPALSVVDRGKFFLKTDVDFEQLTRGGRGRDFMPIADLHEELERAVAPNLPGLALELHMRLAAPLITMLGVLLGIGLIMRGQSRNIFFSLGLCILMGALLYVATLGGRKLGEMELVNPAFAAWLPIFAFGPPALILLDGMQS